MRETQSTTKMSDKKSRRALMTTGLKWAIVGVGVSLLSGCIHYHDRHYHHPRPILVQEDGVGEHL